MKKLFINEEQTDEYGVTYSSYGRMLKSVRLNPNINEIRIDAFNGCSKLKDGNSHLKKTDFLCGYGFYQK